MVSTATGTATTSPSEEPAKCEALLRRLTTAPDGTALQLQKLCGAGVPLDTEFYLCNHTFVALQLRLKVSEPQEDVLHEYALEADKVNPGKGGIYELQCLRSKHHLQVKVQPALGLAELLLPYRDDPTANDMATVIERELWPCMGIYYILRVFSDDANRKSVPLAAGYDDSTKRIEWILEHGGMTMIDKLCTKCPVFSRSYGQPPRLTLIEPDRPKTRGMLLKAFLEVKMLIIRAITQIRTCGEKVLSDKQLADFEAFMIYVYEDCCAGGVQEQYKPEDESMVSLKHLVCGGVHPTNSRISPNDFPATKQEEKTSISNLERSQLECLRCKLIDVTQQLAASGESLDEANIISSNMFTVERTRLGELLFQIQRRLEELEERSRKLECVDDIVQTSAETVKRQKTE